MRLRGTNRLPALLEQGAPLLLSENERDITPDLWSSYKAVCMEIGCGLGSFVIQMAEKNPDTFFFAVDRVPLVVARAASQAAVLGLENVRFMTGDIVTLMEKLPQHQMDVLYLNFSDPWPKERHGKRRLTHAIQLAVFEKLLRRGGHLEFKTDNAPFFEWSLESFTNAHWTVQSVDRNVVETAPLDKVHTGKYTQTEYERKFRKLSVAINHLRATPPSEY